MSFVSQILEPGGGIKLLPFVRGVIGFLLILTLLGFVVGVARIHMAILSFLSAGLLVSLSFFEQEYNRMASRGYASQSDDDAPISSKKNAGFFSFGSEQTVEQWLLTEPVKEARVVVQVEHRNNAAIPFKPCVVPLQRRFETLSPEYRSHQFFFASASMIFFSSSHYRIAAALTLHRHRHPSSLIFGRRIHKSHSLSSTAPAKDVNLTTTNNLITDLPGITPELWDVYETTIRDLVRNFRGLPKYVPPNTECVTNYLCSNQCLLDTTDSDIFGLDRDKARDLLRQQRERFVQETGFSTIEYEFCSRCLTYMGDFCAKALTPEPLISAWYKIKECGMVPRENGLSTYMYAMGMNDAFGETLAEVASFHDLLYEPNEKTVTLRIKDLVAKNDGLGAEQLISLLADKGKGNDLRRLRTFLPVLSFYGTENDVGGFLRVYRQMRNSPSTYIDADTYALVLGTLARLGCFRRDSEPIKEAADAGFSATHGPELFDEIANEMASDIMELTKSSAVVLHNSISQGFGLAKNEWEEGHLPEAVNVPFSSDQVVVDRVEINATTALCPRTGAHLSLFVLDEAQRRHVHDTLVEMADGHYNELSLKPGKGKQNDDQEYGLNELSKFSKWLDERDGAPFTALVDGANIAYFGHADVHYNQIDLVVKELEKMGENPLVIMPEKYSQPKFYLSTGCTQKLTPRDLEVIDRLKSAGLMYLVPARCLDDYYWMLGSVSNQSASRNGAEMFVPPVSENGRFPGLRPMLITNDQMRDHRLALLEPRLFQRWCSSHIVNYNISSYESDEWQERRVHFFPAKFYSREIQTNPMKDGCKVWHIPVAEWGEHDRLCIRLL